MGQLVRRRVPPGTSLAKPAPNRHWPSTVRWFTNPKLGPAARDRRRVELDVGDVAVAEQVASRHIDVSQGY
jgi:hypothetical protein